MLDEVNEVDEVDKVDGMDNLQSTAYSLLPSAFGLGVGV